MGKNRLIRFCAAVCSLLCAGSVLTHAASSADAKKDKAEPLIITSKTLVADNQEKTATFEGNVVARKGTMTLYADRMIVYSKKDMNQALDASAAPTPPAPAKEKDKQGEESAEIDKVEADGNVRLIKGNRVVTAGFATYFTQPEEYVVFIQKPRAAEGPNVVTGTKMTYYLKDDRSVVENSKVFLVNQERKQNPAGPKKER
ncbi:MAG: hypothetical protein GX423_09085 [Nitrospiraceae bacterium]|nr:hypothetical protein [Nitrospiraceae bacterium]